MAMIVTTSSSKSELTSTMPRCRAPDSNSDLLTS
jgi:hypothetical protein